MDAIARKEIEKHGLQEKIDVLTADMFEASWPEDCDLLLLSNVLHDWDLTEVRALLEKALEVLSPEQLWVNPDCGLKTRRWEEVKPSLENMVAAAKSLR